GGVSYSGSPNRQAAPAEWREWRQNNTVFTDIAATQPVQAILSSDGEPEEVPARKVTANLWTVLGAQPLLGRVFNEDEDTRGVRVAVISHGLWQRRFRGAPHVGGRALTTDHRSYEESSRMAPGVHLLPSPPNRDI